ncbi:MAG: TonB-dependent receptor [Bacteroidales bacterium]|nr:TonB-dependent receptor [Bacteroidales bacterium]
MNLLKSILFFLLVMYFGFVLGQNDNKDSIQTLSTFTISSARLEEFSAGIKTVSYDNLIMQQYAHQSISELIAGESSLYVKSYGAGGIATVSLRGTNANHTAVLWNGFNVNSPMNGQMDLSLLPVGFFDAVSIQYGGSSSLWGSGAIGGAIHLSSKPHFNKGINVQLNISSGSFQTHKQSFLVEVSKKRMLNLVKFINCIAENKFLFKNTYKPNLPLDRQSHAKIKSTGLISENHFLLTKKQKINLLFWYQETDREIPPTMLQAESKAFQSDRNLKLSTEWSLHDNKKSIFVRSAYFNDYQTYNDSTSHVYAVNTFQSFINEAETKISVRELHDFNLGINNTFISAVATNLPTNPRQNNSALFISYGYKSKNNRLQFNLSGRQELLSKKLLPFTFSAGTDFEIFKSTSLHAQVARVHRMPTLNDLYWSPGGNENLLPESGYTQEIGFKWNYTYNKIKLSTTPSIFNSNIKNWIIWLPEDNFWRPKNILHVWSRGVDTFSEIEIRKNKFKVSIAVLTNYIVSTNQKAISIYDASYEKQLIYVPMYSGYAKINLSYNAFQITYKHNYVGYRYISADNTQYLTPYSLGSLFISYNRTFKTFGATIYFQCQNIWNEVYMNMATRPMPLRYFNAGISLSYNKQEIN